MPRDNEATQTQLAAVQRNYVTVSKLLHERLQQLEQISQQLVTQRSDAEQLRSQLEAAVRRAEVAEQQLRHGLKLPNEVNKLQQEASDLRACRQEDHQQRVALQEQLNRLKQDLYGTVNSKQQLSEQLQEQCTLNHTANTIITKMRQQLEDEQAEGRATASQLHALRDVLARDTAEQHDMQKQLATLKSHAKTAEEALAAERALCKQLQQELQSAKGGQANSALRLLDLQTSQQLLDEQLTKALEALATEQAAKANADSQINKLQLQLAAVQQCTAAAEAEREAAAVALGRAQHELTEAHAACFAAEEARRTADAATKLVTQRLAEAQKQASRERSVAEATQHELKEHLAVITSELQMQCQQEQSWRFRQLEAMSRAVSRMDQLQARLAGLDKAADVYAGTLKQQHYEQQDKYANELCRLDSWCTYAEELSVVGGKINAALVHIAQQWAAKQQMLRSSDKGLQVLQKQVDELQQQLSIASVIERKLQSQLVDVQSAREHDREESKHELAQAAAALAAAEAAAAAADNANAQQQAAVAQLETKLATAGGELIALRFQLASKDSEVTAMGTNVKAASRRLQRLAGTACSMVAKLEQVGALQPQNVAALFAQLGVLMGRPSTAMSASSRPDTPASGAASSDAGSSPAAALNVADAAGSKQLLDGLGCLQQQMQILAESMEQLADQYPKLLASWQDSEREFSSVTNKLLHAEESLASNYTCLVCMEVFHHPVSVVPCGHNYCKACFVSTLNSVCRECSSSVQPASCIAAPALEQLCAKYEYKMLCLQGLQSLLAQRQVHSISSTRATAAMEASK